MAVNVSNAFVGNPRIDGGVFFRAPLDTATMPDDASTALDPAYGDHGAVGEDGISVTPTRSTQSIKMFGGEDFTDVQTEFGVSVTIALLEDDNENALKTAFGDANVEVTPASASEGTLKTIYYTSDPLPLSQFVADCAYGDKLKRYFIEVGRVTELAEIKDVHSDVTRRQLTVKAYRTQNAANKHAPVVEFRTDGVLVP